MSRGDNVHGILGAIGPFWAKWGVGRVPRSASFFCLVNHATYLQLRNGRFSPNVVTKRISVSRRGIRKDSFENFHFMGHLPPPAPNLKSKIGQTGTSLTAGYRSRDALQWYTVYSTVVVQGSFRGPVNFFVRRTVAELRGVKFAKFSDFGLFSPYKTPKTYLPVTSLQPRGYIAESFQFFRVVVEGPRGCLPGPEISCDLC